jgi:hypothetical protein
MLDAGDNLEQIFTWREPRSVSKSLTVQYDKTLYLLEDNEKSRRVMGKYIEMYHYPDGRLNSGETMLHFPALPMIGWLRLTRERL